MAVDDTTAPAGVADRSATAIRPGASASRAPWSTGTARRGQSIALATAIWAAALLGGLAAAPLLGGATTSGLEPTSRSEGPAHSTATTVMGVRAGSTTTVAVALSPPPPSPAAATPRRPLSRCRASAPARPTARPEGPTRVRARMTRTGRSGRAGSPTSEDDCQPSPGGSTRGAEAKRLRASRSDRYLVSISPRTLLPARSSGRRERAEPALAGGDRHDAAAHPALTGKADLVEPVARALVEPGGGQHRQHMAAGRRRHHPLACQRVDAPVGQRRPHHGQVAGRDQQRALACVHVRGGGGVEVEAAIAGQQVGDAVIALVARRLRSVHVLVDRQRPPGEGRQARHDRRPLVLSGIARHEAGGGQRAALTMGLLVRFSDSSTAMTELNARPVPLAPRRSRAVAGPRASHTRAKTNTFDTLCTENGWSASPTSTSAPSAPAMQAPNQAGSADSQVAGCSWPPRPRRPTGSGRSPPRAAPSPPPRGGGCRWTPPAPAARPAGADGRSGRGAGSQCRRVAGTLDRDGGPTWAATRRCIGFPDSAWYFVVPFVR